MIPRLFLILLTLALGLADVRLETTISPDTITVGDHVRLTITADAPEGQVVNFPDISFESDAVQLVDKKLTEKSVTYVLTFWETGEAVIPEIPIQILENGKLLPNLKTDSLRVMISSVLDANSTDIRPIKDMQDVKLKKGWVQLIYASGLILSLLLAFVLWRRRVRVIRKAEKWKAPPEPPHIHAKNQLAALDLPYPITRESAEAYYLALSGIFRKFLEDEFYIKSLEMTTSELQSKLAEMDFEKDLQYQTVALLQKSDLSKFAGHVPDSVQFEDDKVLTGTLVDAFHAASHI